jgi:type I restriction enzyme S subunit
MRETKLPKDWKIVNMGDVFTIERGGSPRPIEDFITDKPEGLNWIKIGDTKGITKYIKSTKEKIKPEGLKKSRMVFEDDFILSNSMSFGRPYIMKTTGCIHDGWLVIRKNETINNDYLYLVLTSNQVYIQFCNLAKGSTVKNLNIEAVKKVIIPIPPLETQQAIVSKIEELFSELDKGIEDLKTAQLQLKTYRQSVLKWAFEGKLTNQNVKEGLLPKGWNEVEIKNVCENIKVGIVIKPTNFYSKDNSGIKSFRSANVREFQINDSNWVYFTKESNEINYRTKLKEGDVLLVRSGYPGTSCVVTKKFEGCNAIDILIATPKKEKILSEYLCCFNNSPLGKGMFRDKSRGVAQKHLNVGEYSKLKINIPSLEEQYCVVQEIESRLSVADKMEESIAQSLQQAEALRQSILKKAFSGEFV